MHRKTRRVQGYNPTWAATSLRIRKERAGDCCERCGLKNGLIGRREGKLFHPLPAAQLAELERHTAGMTWKEKQQFYKRQGITRIMLSVAHLDRGRTNDDDSNLLAVCQRCHFQYDLPQIITSQKYGSETPWTTGNLFRQQ